MGDTVVIFPIFSKKANEEAIQKMNPRVSKSMWISPSNVNDTPYGFSLDSAVTIFTATRE